MAYRRSIFRNEFDNYTDTHINVVLESCDKNDISQELKNSVLAAAIFQVSAAMENYLKDIISNWIFEIKKCNYSDLNIPIEMKAIILLKMQQDIYKKYFMGNNGEISSLNSMISKIEDINKINSDGILQILNVGSIVNDKKYPSINNIIQLFNRLGIKNIFNEVNKLGRYDSKLFLTSFMDVRTEIAHSTQRTYFNANDVIDKLNRIKKLVGFFDRILYKFVMKKSISCCWK